MSVTFDKVFDARGLNCPMPLVNARKEIGTLDPGQVLKVMATDRGSVATSRAGRKVAKNVELVAQETENDDGNSIYVHYVKRTAREHHMELASQKTCWRSRTRNLPFA